MEMEKTILSIITNSGEAKNLCMKAIKHAREDDFEQANQCVEDAEQIINKAHKKQSELIQLEARGENINPTILLVHGQDHLMTVMMLKDITKEVIKLYTRFN